MKLDQNKTRKYRTRRVLTTVLVVVIKILTFAVPALIFVFSNYFGELTELALGILFVMFIVWDFVFRGNRWTNLSTLAIIFLFAVIMLVLSPAPSWIVELMIGLLYILYTLAYFFLPNDKY